jgi:hypothetical protein
LSKRKAKGKGKRAKGKAKIKAKGKGKRAEGKAKDKGQREKPVLPFAFCLLPCLDFLLVDVAPPPALARLK